MVRRMAVLVDQFQRRLERENRKVETLEIVEEIALKRNRCRRGDRFRAPLRARP
jgi:hypothetical protein